MRHMPPIVPFKAGDRVVHDTTARRGTVVEIISDAPDGADQFLRVQWEDGGSDSVFGRNLRSVLEKRAGIGADAHRCPRCGFVLPSHSANCSLAG